MNVHEQRMCESQGELFELSIDRFKCGSAFFISKYMYNDIVKELDNLDDFYNYISPYNMISIMSSNYPSLNTSVGVKYPYPVMRWIGYIYRAWSIITHKPSSRIYRDFKVEDLLPLYDTYHTLSVEEAVSRLEELVYERTKPTKTDYEIFKSVMMAN